MISLMPPDVVCPDFLLERAQASGRSNVAIANAGTDVVMQSARDATDAGIMTPVFVGVKEDIHREADALGWNIGAYAIIESDGTEEDAAIKAAKACGNGQAGVIMKGHVHTDTFMRAVLNRDAGLRTGKRLGHVFHMTVPGREGALLISDAAVNVAPDFETQQSLLAYIIQVAQAAGIARPNVAVLSATEEVSEAVPSSVAADALVTWSKAQNLPSEIFGPVAFDLAVSPKAAAIKGVERAAVGNADALLVPTIEVGNALFKMMVYFMGACAAGVVLGARVPVILTSRADPPQARLASAALAALLESVTA